MSRYIDADKLKQHYAWWNNEDKETFDEIVSAQPTADVVEVVRCKDCKYYEPDGVCANINFLSVRPNDYCSYAEKI